MWRCALWWLMCAPALVIGTIDLRFFAQTRQYTSTSRVNCLEYSLPPQPVSRISKLYDAGLRLQKKPTRNQYEGVPIASGGPGGGALAHPHIATRRRRFAQLQLIPGADIVKEHAKLVQDINSLRQVVFVAPMVDENRDYDDSILHEVIDTSTTTTPKPTTARYLRLTKPSTISVLLLDGASQRQLVKTMPQKYQKPYISLVGTSVSPLVKHPYPFVMHSSAGRKPVKICMPTMPPMYSTNKRPSFWQRLLNSLIPR